jgi:hypothetical protein
LRDRPDAAAAAVSDDSPASERRDEIEKWVADFFWEFHDSGMSNSEAALIIVATLETCLPISDQTRSVRLTDPPTLFQAWKMQSD